VVATTAKTREPSLSLLNQKNKYGKIGYMAVEMRIMLAGGWDERDQRPLEEIFASWIGGNRLLYLPAALVHPFSKEAGYRRLQRASAVWGIESITAWMDLAKVAGRELFDYDAVYLEGGNTYYLLQQLRAHELALALEDFARAGRPVYGSGAGAVALGYDISSIAHIDQNVIGLVDLSGLDLVLGHTLWVGDKPDAGDRIQAYVARSGIPSIALGDHSGVYRLGDRLFAAGTAPLVHYTLKGRIEAPPGAQISLG